MSFLLRTLPAALLFALGIGSARADSFVDALATNTTIPLPSQSCLYVDQFNGTSYNDTKLCSGWATAIGALSATNNLSDLTNLGTARTNLGLGSAAARAPAGQPFRCSMEQIPGVAYRVSIQAISS